MKKHLLASIFVSATLATASVFQAAPAEALSFDGQSAIFGSSDIGKSFTIDFVDNYIGGVSNSGLKSQAKVTINSFNTFSNRTEILLGLALSNQSTADIDLNGFGFDVGAIINNTLNTDIPVLFGTGNTEVVSNVPSDFSDFSGFTLTFPNFDSPDPVGDVDVAFGTILFGINKNVTDSLVVRLALDSSLNANDQVVLDSFAAGYLNRREFGIGRPIPTPALLPGLVGLAVGAIRKKQKTQIVQDV